jgi:predicted lipid-binding transport protein (Tim44 family)
VQQLLELIIFAALAAVVLYQLYAVLGRRVGRQPEDAVAPALAPRSPDVDPRARELDASSPSDVAAVRARDPGFDPAKFLDGARQAYELIVKSYATADRTALRKLVSPQVMTVYEKALDARAAEGRTETVEFIHPPRADLEGVKVEGDVVRARVRFLAEFRSRTKGPEGEAVDDRRTAEIWTFERKLSAKDPNWTLVRVDAAEA